MSLRMICPEPGAATVILSTREALARRRQLHRLVGGGERHDRVAQPLVGHACRDERFPVADREIHRRQRACRGHRTRDDRAGGQFALDREIGTETQHRRLQQHAQHAGDRRERAA